MIIILSWISNELIFDLNCSNKLLPQTLLPVVNSQSRHTIVDTVRQVMIHWIKRHKTTTRHRTPVAESDNSLKAKQYRIHKRVAQDLILHRPCMARVMQHWTRLMWVLDTHLLPHSFLISILSLTQSYEKQSFHSGTPPPFNMVGSQTALNNVNVRFCLSPLLYELLYKPCFSR